MSATGPTSTDADRLRFLARAAEARAFVERVDPSLLRLASEVDETLIAWSLSQSPSERLEHNTAFARFADSVT